MIKKNLLSKLPLILLLVISCNRIKNDKRIDLNFDIDYGEFIELKSDSVKVADQVKYFKNIRNTLFYYAYSFDIENNYTFMYSASYAMKNSRTMFFISDVADDALEVTVNMEVTEPELFSLYDPAKAKTITLTNKSFYSANFLFEGDSIILSVRKTGKPTFEEKSDPKLKRQINQFRKSKTSKGLKILKTNHKSITNRLLEKYERKILTQENVDDTKYLLSGDSVFLRERITNEFSRQEYFIYNKQNLFRSFVLSDQPTDLEFDSLDNILRFYRKVKGDHYSGFNELVWTTENEYDNSILLSSSRYKKVDDQERDFYDKAAFTYKLYRSDKEFFKIEIYRRIGEAKRTFQSSLIFDARANWIEVTKNNGKISRKIKYK